MLTFVPLFMFGLNFLFSDLILNDPFMFAITQLTFAFGILFLSVGLLYWIPIYRTEGKSLKEIERIIQEIDSEASSWTSKQPAYLLADSIDREILGIIKDLGGNILDIGGRVIARALIELDEELFSRLAKMHLLGLVSLSTESRRVILTSAGADALSIPAVMFISRIPQNIWKYVFQQKVGLRQEKWGTVVTETAKALEAILKDRLTHEINQNVSEWDIIKENLPKKSIEKWAAGDLLTGLRKLHFVKENSFEDYLVRELVKLRNLIHDKKETYTFGPRDADICDIYLSLILRSWYTLR